MSCDTNEGLAFPPGLRGRARNAVFPCPAPQDDAASEAPVVRLFVPAQYPRNDPPFPLPARARWELCRPGREAGGPSVDDVGRFTFVVWDASARYRSWLRRSIEGDDDDAGIIVVLHESDHRVPPTLGGRPVLRLDCKGAWQEKLFALIGVLVVPSVFQSIVGADSADFRHLARFGGELRLFDACADRVETIAARLSDFRKCADFPPSKVTGTCVATVVPLALPVVESIDALLWASQYQDVVTDDVDVVLTAFAHRENEFSLKMLWIAGDHHSQEDA